MGLWNFGRNFPFKKSWYFSRVDKTYDTVTVKQLLFDNAYSFSNGGDRKAKGISDFKDHSDLLEKVFSKRKIPGETRRMFFERYLLNGFRILLDRIMEEMVVREGIFTFPKRQAFMFVAQIDHEYPGYKYDIKTGSGRVNVFFLVHPKYHRLKANILIIVYGKYRKMISEEVKKGHKYPDYLTVVKYIHDDLDKRFLQSKLRFSGDDLEQHNQQVQVQED